MAKDIDYTHKAVDRSGRKSNMNIFMVMLGFTFFSASMWAGQKLAEELDFVGFWECLLLGGLLLSLYTGALGYIGSESGLSLNLLACRVFGVKGSLLPNIMITLTQIGWFGVGLSMFAIPMAKVFFGLEVSSGEMPWQGYLLIALAGALMTSSAYFGIKSLTVISYIAVPLVAILGTVAIVMAVRSGDGNIVEMFDSDSQGIEVLTGVGLVIGSFVSGGTTTPNFTRFAKSAKVGLWTTVVAFFFGNSLMFCFGAFSSVCVGGSDIFDVMLRLNLFYMAVLTLGLNIWTTNDNTLYSAGLGLSNILGFSKRSMVILSGIIGSVTANWLYWNFCSWMEMLGRALPPIGIIIILDYFMNRRQFLCDTKQPNQVNWPAVNGVIAGVLVALLNWGFPVVNGMVAACVCYLLLRKFRKRR